MGELLQEYYQKQSIKQINDLQEERKQVKFDVRQMTYLLDGGKEMTLVCFCY